MTDVIRVTRPLLDVVEVFLRAFNNGNKSLHGWIIAKEVQRSGPTVYGVLDRLEGAGWITGKWEPQSSEANKPRRRVYHLTSDGVEKVKGLLAARRPEAQVLRPIPEVPSPSRPLRPEPGWAFFAFFAWLRTLRPGGA